jgi:molecular chaperone GrpE
VTEHRPCPGPDPAPAGTGPEAAGADMAEVVESELDQARRAADEYLADLRRVAADFDNYRKRVARDAQAQAARAGEAKVSEGVQLVRQQLVDLLRRRGLEEIASEPGTEFDPHLHEALSQQPSDLPEGAISEVWQRGYTLGDRVMRPARVVVSSGSPAEED